MVFDFKNKINEYKIMNKSKGFSIFLRHFLMVKFITLACSFDCRADLKVFLGFMDEEVSPVLASTLKHTRQKVIVLERGSFEAVPKFLFEKPLTDFVGYEKDVAPRVISIKSGSRSELPKNLGATEDRLAKNLAKRFGEIRSELDSLVISKSNRKTDASLSSSLIVFNPQADDKNDVIFIIRSPEMGLEPDLVAPILKVILGAVFDTDVFPQGVSAGKEAVDFYAFGTSGAVSSFDGHGEPGELIEVERSLFLGLRRILGSSIGENKFKINIEKIERGYGPAVPLFSKSVDNSASQAIKTLKKFWSTLNLSEWPDLMNKMMNFGSAGKAGLTVSFFAGKNEKIIGSKFRILTVNMEDFHVIEALNYAEDHSHRKFRESKVYRLNCDPAQISKKVQDRVSSWIRSKNGKYSIRQYQDAILWGLRGQKLSELFSIKESMSWSVSSYLHFFDHFIAPVIDPTSGLQMVVDPFLLEVSTNFLTDAIGAPDKESDDHSVGSLFKVRRYFSAIGKEDDFYLGLLSFQVLRLLDDSRDIYLLSKLMRAKSLISKEIALEIRRLFLAPDHSDLKIRNKVSMLMRELSVLDLKQAVRDDKFMIFYARANNGPLKIEEVNKLRKKLVHYSEFLSTKKEEYLLNSGKIRLLGAFNELPAVIDDFDKQFEGWIRLGKWDGNQERSSEHLTTADFAVRDAICFERIFEGDSITSAEVIEDFTPSLKEECVDRMSYKHGLAFLTVPVADKIVTSHLGKKDHFAF